MVRFAVSTTSSRRDFLKRSGAAATLTGAALAGGPSIARAAHAAGDDPVRIALIGCGGRGVGAAVNALANSSYANVKVVALADAFQDRVDFAARTLTNRFPEKVDVPEQRRFTGLDCYAGALALGAEIDLVLLCGPPGVRPLQFEAAVQAGKHVFMEKPVATDAPGVRRVMAANEEAKRKGLAVAVGFHLRHEQKHQKAIAAIHDGAIGDLCYLRSYFNSGGVWVRPRRPEQTEMEYQTRNWYYFNWLSGDHIVEQHVHDIDVCNWMADAVPVEAQGMGGRQVRIGEDYGEIFDHHVVEFTYPSGVRMFSQCRHQPGCWSSFAEHAHGTKGYINIQGSGAAEMFVVGQDRVRWDRGPAGHQVEMDVLFQKILAGEPHNEADYGAKSTMTAILGRMATYSGKIIRWDDALASNRELVPRELAWDADPGPKPGPDGIYPCAIPGVTEVL